MLTWVMLGGFAAIFISLMAIDLIQAPARKRALAEYREKLSNEARLRGWSFSVHQENLFTAHEFAGRSEGIAWRLTARENRRTRHTTTRTQTLWQCDDVGLPAGSMLAVWPSFGTPDVAQAGEAPRFVLDLMLTPLINSIGASHVSRDLFASAQPVAVRDERLKAYLLRATDEDSMNRFLDAGGRDALVSVASWFPLRDSANHLVVATATAGGVSVVVSGWASEPALVEKISAFGISFARAAKASAG